MRRALVSLALLLSGCAGMETSLENRIACTVARDSAYAVSLWGPVGITAKIAPRDAKVVCA